MPKYWVKNYFAHGRFPEVGQKQKTEKKEREKERERERAKVGDNNGQAMHGARKHAWRTQAAWAKSRKKICEGNHFFLQLSFYIFPLVGSKKVHILDICFPPKWVKNWRMQAVCTNIAHPLPPPARAWGCLKINFKNIRIGP